MDLREYECPKCHHIFFVDCDADEYPDYCPYCSGEIDGRADKVNAKPYKIDYSADNKL